MIKMTILAACYLTILCFFLSSAFYYINTKNSSRKFGKIASSLAGIGLVTNAIILLLRVSLTGSGPFSNGLEFLILLSWLCVLFYLMFEFKYKTKAPGTLMLLLAGLFMLFVAIVMPRGLITVNSQPPVLKSIWLSSHVFTAVLAYGGFALAAIIAASYLLYSKKGFAAVNVEGAVYGIIVFSFIMLTITIVLGAIWAEQAWGRYWSWDPKEIWSLITWGIYAMYFHLRKSKHRNDQVLFIFAIGGFIVVLFTFFGVNFLMRGLHSYS